MKLWNWFYGFKNPYSVIRPPTYMRWCPEILTIRWWRWCFAHEGKLARGRLHYYYIRNIKFRILRLPICWVLGHKKYETMHWSWHGVCCSRCHRTLVRILHSTEK